MAESCVEAESYVASGSDDETTDSTKQQREQPIQLDFMVINVITDAKQLAN